MISLHYSQEIEQLNNINNIPEILEDSIKSLQDANSKLIFKKLLSDPYSLPHKTIKDMVIFLDLIADTIRTYSQVYDLCVHEFKDFTLIDESLFNEFLTAYGYMPLLELLYEIKNKELLISDPVKVLQIKNPNMELLNEYMDKLRNENTDEKDLSILVITENIIKSGSFNMGILFWDAKSSKQKDFTDSLKRVLLSMSEKGTNEK